jgi:hypothetical protein
MTDASFDRCAKMFCLDAKLLKTTRERIPFPATWGLAKGAGLYPHQWQSLAEQIVQNGKYGGGADGSAPGVGKTHPNAAQTVVYYWIERQYQLLNRDDKDHHPDGYEGTDPCPRQSEFPLPCSCSPANWTHPDHLPVIPSGAGAAIVLANTGAEWAKCILDLWWDAPMLDYEFMPFKVGIEHSATEIIMNNKIRMKLREEQEVAKAKAQAEWDSYELNRGKEMPEERIPRPRKKSTNPFKALTPKELAMCCRMPDLSAAEELCKIDPETDEEREIPFVLQKWIPSPHSIAVVNIPGDATPKNASYIAKCFFLLYTPSIIVERFNRTTITALFVPLQNTADSKKQKGAKKPVKPKSFTSVYRMLLDLGTVILDEGHNLVNLKHGAFQALISLKVAKMAANDDVSYYYWILSGTLRESGPAIIAMHFGELLAPSWWTKDQRTPEEHRDTETLDLKRRALQYIAHTIEANKANDVLRPYQRFIAFFNRIRDGVAKDYSKAQLEENMERYTTTMANIVEALVIERDDETISIDGKPLLSTANIKQNFAEVALEYSRDMVDVIENAKGVVLKQAELYAEKKKAERDERIKAGKTVGPEKKAGVNRMQGFYNLVIASSCPGLITYLQKHADIDPHSDALTKHYDNPESCPFWKDFEEIVEGDMKWAWIASEAQKIAMTPKKSNPDLPQKVLLGTKLPVIALLYAIVSSLRFIATMYTANKYRV